MDPRTPIYLDHAAATPMRPEVSRAMAPFREGIVGNPSSAHRWGRAARAALEDARERTAFVLGVSPEAVYFVRGGTESINLAILGRADRELAKGDGPVVLLRSAIEHAAVRESMDAAEAAGCSVEVLAVGPDGGLLLPDPDELRGRAVRLISVQWVNHETGLVLPIPELAEVCGRADVPLHVDAVQAVGKISFDLGETEVDLLSLSSHKLGGPRGVGALVVRPEIEIAPRQYGGGQERGLRPGTEDVAGAVGLSHALEISAASLNLETKRLAGLRELLEARLGGALPELRIHGKEGPRAPHILSIGVPGLPRDVLPGALDLAGVAVSAGSACRSGATSVSPVLQALYGEVAADVAPLRLSLGWSTTREEVEEAARRIPPVVERVRNA